MKFPAFLAILMWGMTGSESAVACDYPPAPMPPHLERRPGESDAAFRMRWSAHVAEFNSTREKERREAEKAVLAKLWDESGAIALIEVVSREEQKEPRFGEKPIVWTGPTVVVRPIAWLKGDMAANSVEAVPATLSLRYTTLTSCGPEPDWPVMRGKVGERYVAYFWKGVISPTDLTSVVRLTAITDSRVTERLQ